MKKIFVWFVVLPILAIPMAFLAGCASNEPIPATPVTIADPSGLPKVHFDTIPKMGTSDILVGHVSGIKSASDYKLAIYVHTVGWYTKPTWADPDTYIKGDGTFNCDTTTGDGDENASEIAAYLVKSGVDIPLGKGGDLPEIPGSVTFTKVSR